MIRFLNSEYFDIYNQAPKYVAQTGNGCTSEHTRVIDKSGVPKEAAQDESALSDGISADRQIPPQQPLYLLVPKTMPIEIHNVFSSRYETYSAT
jgi:hypothetical protein